MSKALSVVAALAISGIALTPIFLASKNPEQYQSKRTHQAFNPKSANAIEKISYAFGYEVAKQTPPELDIDAFSAGAKAAHNKETMPYSMKELNAASMEFMQVQQAKHAHDATQIEHAQAAQEQGQAQAQPPQPQAPHISVEENKKFLIENAKKAGVHVTTSGLQYSIDKEGTGKQPKATDTVEVNYEGKLINGTVFDSSFQRGQSIQFPLNQVIKGWTEGVQLMKEGAEYTFYIPAELAYGEQDMGSIPPHSTLIFKVQLIKVK